MQQLFGFCRADWTFLSYRWDEFSFLNCVVKRHEFHGFGFLSPDCLKFVSDDCCNVENYFRHDKGDCDRCKDNKRASSCPFRCQQTVSTQNLVTFLGVFDFSNRQGFLSQGFKACFCRWTSAHQSILILSFNSNTALTDLDLVIAEISSGIWSDSADGREVERLTSGWDFSGCSAQDPAAFTEGGFRLLCEDVLSPLLSWEWIYDALFLHIPTPCKRSNNS